MPRMRCSRRRSTRTRAIWTRAPRTSVSWPASSQRAPRRPGRRSRSLPRVCLRVPTTRRRTQRLGCGGGQGGDGGGQARRPHARVARLTYYQLAIHASGPTAKAERSKNMTRATDLMDKALAEDARCAFAAQGMAILIAEDAFAEMAGGTSVTLPACWAGRPRSDARRTPTRPSRSWASCARCATSRACTCAWATCSCRRRSTSVRTSRTSWPRGARWGRPRRRWCSTWRAPSTRSG